MRQAILTRYLGPTNSRNPRVKAWCQGGSITLTWDDALDQDENHLKAATALAWRYGWLDRHHLQGGGLPDGRGNCYVLVPGPKT